MIADGLWKVALLSLIVGWPISFSEPPAWRSPLITKVDSLNVIVDPEIYKPSNKIDRKGLFEGNRVDGCCREAVLPCYNVASTDFAAWNQYFGFKIDTFQWWFIWVKSAVGMRVMLLWNSAMDIDKMTQLVIAHREVLDECRPGLIGKRVGYTPAWAVNQSSGDIGNNPRSLSLFSDNKLSPKLVGGGIHRVMTKTYLFDHQDWAFKGGKSGISASLSSIGGLFRRANASVQQQGLRDQSTEIQKSEKRDDVGRAEIFGFEPILPVLLSGGAIGYLRGFWRLRHYLDLHKRWRGSLQLLCALGCIGGPLFWLCGDSGGAW